MFGEQNFIFRPVRDHHADRRRKTGEAVFIAFFAIGHKPFVLFEHKRKLISANRTKHIFYLLISRIFKLSVNMQ